MNLFDVLRHLAGFLMPAAAVALGVVLSDRWLTGRRPPLLRSLGLNFAVGSMALFAGLLAFGVDAKMATYALVVVACATAQWWLGRRR